MDWLLKHGKYLLVAFGYIKLKRLKLTCRAKASFVEITASSRSMSRSFTIRITQKNGSSEHVSGCASKAMSGEAQSCIKTKVCR